MEHDHNRIHTLPYVRDLWSVNFRKDAAPGQLWTPQSATISDATWTTTTVDAWVDIPALEIVYTPPSDGWAFIAFQSNMANDGDLTVFNGMQITVNSTVVSQAGLLPVGCIALLELTGGTEYTIRAGAYQWWDGMTAPQTLTVVGDSLGSHLIMLPWNKS